MNVKTLAQTHKNAQNTLLAIAQTQILAQLDYLRHNWLYQIIGFPKHRVYKKYSFENATINFLYYIVGYFDPQVSIVATHCAAL